MQVLDEIVSTATLHKFYRTAVNAKKLMIVSDPDIIDVYSLEHIYTHGKALYLKSLPTYHYSIQPISDISFSSFEDTLYISAIDPISDVSTILIYRAGFPATTSLYHTIPLDKIYSRPDL